MTVEGQRSESHGFEPDAAWLERLGILAHLAEGGPGRVLLLGGATSACVMPLARAGHRVALVSRSSTVVRDTGRQASGFDVDCIVGDARQPPTAGPFDAVLCVGPLHRAGSLDDVAAVIAACATVLGPGGRLFGAFRPAVAGMSERMADAGQAPQPVPAGASTGAWSTEAWATPAAPRVTGAFLARPRAIERIARGAGFTDVRVAPLPGGGQRGRQAVVLATRHDGVSWCERSWEALHRDDLHALARLRQQVFVVEQDCPYPDLDGRDPDAVHLLGFEGDELVAHARLFGPPRAAIGRVVVARSHRGAGLGRALMVEARQRLERRWGEVPVHVGAQAHLARFYRSLGYRVVGPPYDEDGIEHVPMRLR